MGKSPDGEKRRTASCLIDRYYKMGILWNKLGLRVIQGIEKQQTTEILINIKAAVEPK